MSLKVAWMKVLFEWDDKLRVRIGREHLDSHSHRPRYGDTGAIRLRQLMGTCGVRRAYIWCTRPAAVFPTWILNPALAASLPVLSAKRPLAMRRCDGFRLDP
jgi:hypothetical protein